jgi:GT2 family glycosyltransferase
MYRSRVAWLLGDYSRHRFTTEDYDYWMRVNEMLRLRHADFDDSVYDYRFHATSLTARDEELGITSGRDRLMVFDDFRRDALLTPALWQVRSASEGARPVADRLTACIRSAGHLVFGGTPEQTDHWPTHFLTAISVLVVDDLVAATEPPPEDRSATLRVLAVVDPDFDPTIDPHPDWDLCTVVGERPPGGTMEPYRRWLSVANAESLFAAAEVRARSEEFRALEDVLFDGSKPTVEATVVVCTHKIVEALSDSIQALVQQDADPETYEILLVNNRPSDQDLASEVERLRHTGDVRRSGLIRVVHCPIPGLSHARNAALSEAAGGIILCIDDDAVASKSLVSEAVRIFAERPHVGIIGGHIRLDPPDPPPPVLNPGWERYWSQFSTGAEECREVDQWWQFPWGACWCARRDVLIEMGGFRSRYGRVGNDFSGGEEIIAAALARRLGHAVAVAPELEVAHRVDSSRYSWRHVRNTIIAGTLVNYQAQRDLYLPMWESIGSTIKNLLSPSYDRTVGANNFFARARHWIYRKQAWIRLLRVQLGDRWRRLWTPRM